MVDTLAAPDTFEYLWLFILKARRHQYGNRLADDLVG